jgi:hypothetical protein
MKVYELAKMLNVGPIELVEDIKSYGISLRNHMSDIEVSDLHFFLNKTNIMDNCSKDVFESVEKILESPSEIKVYELAKKLDINNSQMLVRLNSFGIKVSNAMSSISYDEMYNFLNRKAPVLRNGSLDNAQEEKRIRYYTDGVKDIPKLVEFLERRGILLREINEDDDLNCDILITSSLSALTKKERYILFEKNPALVLFVNTDFDSLEDLLEVDDVKMIKRSCFLPDLDSLLGEDKCSLDGFPPMERILFKNSLELILQVCEGILREESLSQSNKDRYEKYVGLYSCTDKNDIFGTITVAFEDSNLVPSHGEFYMDNNLSADEKEVAMKTAEDCFRIFNKMLSGKKI